MDWILPYVGNRQLRMTSVGEITWGGDVKRQGHLSNVLTFNRERVVALYSCFQGDACVKQTQRESVGLEDPPEENISRVGWVCWILLNGGGCGSNQYFD